MKPASTPPDSAQPRLLLPDAPVLVQSATGGFLALTTDGAFESLTADQARRLAQTDMPLVCHAPRLAHALKLERLPAYDLLELFAFVRPAQFCVPSPRGLARALSLMEPENNEDECLVLRHAMRHLLSDVMALADKAEAISTAGIAAMMGLAGQPSGNTQDGWPWHLPVLAALGRQDTPPSAGEMRHALRIWEKLPEWAVHAPEPPAGHHGVSGEEAEASLNNALSLSSRKERPSQTAYARALTHAFAPIEEEGKTNLLLAEAGTGTGKTLGYLTPAALWAQKNGGAVWISTYTRNLQRQIEQEASALYTDTTEKSRKVVTRKGRENYLCLLNVEDAAQSHGVLSNPQQAVTLGLLLRWAAATQDGDFNGRDFPGWLPGLLGWSRVFSYADRRGECIYAACAHFDKCFIEKSVRKSKRADIVIANHALVMHQAALSDVEDDLPQRFIFDEGHHLFDAADSAFGAELSGTSAADLRRWLLGSEGGTRSRARGLKKRLEGLVAEEDEAARKDLDDILAASLALPGQQWRQRLSEAAPKGPSEAFLQAVTEQVMARAPEPKGYYSPETEVHPATPRLGECALSLARYLRDLDRPLRSLAERLHKRLTTDVETLEAAERDRLRYVSASLLRRSQHMIRPWIAMLESIPSAQSEGTVDWLEITRLDGRDHDAGFYRAHLDPAALFAAALKPHARGLAVTSATLRDPQPDDVDGWQTPLLRTGAAVLANEGQNIIRHAFASPFDYAAQTRIFVVRDVDKKNTAEVAAAMAGLMKAAGGGALGLFTAVQRLRGVHGDISGALSAAGLPLYAQHVDPLDTATLIDIFRAEENACLLGTDATRDGIDVPGRSLRLVIYDRVPWPKPTILHKARRDHFGKAYDDMLTRFKLQQAYGRLIRRSDDRGVFVILDGALPTRLTTAFPEGVEVIRCGIKEALAETSAFLSVQS